MGILEVSLILLLFFLLYKYGTRNMHYWLGKGVEEYTWNVPFLGSYYKMFFRLDDPLNYMKSMYTAYKKKRFGAVNIFNNSFLAICDPDLLKQILVKDAEYFINRYDWEMNPQDLISKSLSTLKGEKWRGLRTVMSTVFTAAKMKDMFLFMNKCSEQATKYLEKKLTDCNSDVLEIQLKDYFSRYGADVIASTAFGVEVDSFKDPKNEFFQAGQAIKKGFNGSNIFKITLIMMFPDITKKFNLTFVDRKTTDFITDIVSETIREREKRGIVRKDMIHVLTESRKAKAVGDADTLVKGKLPELTDVDIAAQGMLFYFAGFDVIATAMSFICYELALNPDVQQTLFEEIENFEVTYDTIMHQMTYLDMVVHETLRKWPPAASTDRVATKQYTIPKTEDSPEVVLEPGDKVLIPIVAFHRDPEYFPDPEKFDPERFRDEKNTIHPYTFLPFGLGLRHCIGMRYALMEAKTCLVHLLKKFEVVPVEKTQIPIELSKSDIFLLSPKKDIWLGLKPRQQG